MTSADRRPDEGACADERLHQLGLTRERLLAAADAAIAAYNSVSSFSSRQAGAMKMWLDGIEAIRAELVGPVWQLYDHNGLEGVINAERSIIILFQGCERCCASQLPRPRSPKDNAPESFEQSEMFEAHEMGARTTAPGAGPSLYYLIVDNDGRAELTNAVIRGGVFTDAWERILLRVEGVTEVALALPDLDESDFQITIARK